MNLTFLYMTWDCLILLFRDDVNKWRRNYILFLNLNMVLRNSTPWRLAYIWQSKCVGRIIAIKTERTQFSFEATLSLASRHRIVKSLIIMMMIIIIKIIVIMIIIIIIIIIITVYSQLFYLVAIRLWNVFVCMALMRFKNGRGMNVF